MDSAYRCMTVELAAFHPPPFATAEDQRLNCLCPVRALRQYLVRTADFRRHDQLLVSWAAPYKGKLLSHWIVEAIYLLTWPQIGHVSDLEPHMKVTRVGFEKVRFACPHSSENIRSESH